MITNEHAERFAAEWIAAWNSHELEAILAHYAEDVEARSPIIARLTGDPSGIIRGKDALRAYFIRGLRTYPELVFEPLGVFAGVDGVGILYRGVGGLRVVEVFRLNDAGLVSHVAVHYESLA